MWKNPFLAIFQPLYTFHHPLITFLSHIVLLRGHILTKILGIPLPSTALLLVHLGPESGPITSYLLGKKCMTKSVGVTNAVPNNLQDVWIVCSGCRKKGKLNFTKNGCMNELLLQRNAFFLSAKKIEQGRVRAEMVWTFSKNQLPFKKYWLKYYIMTPVKTYSLNTTFVDYNDISIRYEPTIRYIEITTFG